MNLYRVYDSVAEEMEGVRDIYADALASDEGAVVDLLGQVGKFRGKMLRPALVLLCGKLCGGVVHEHRVVAAVLEMFHMATLVHDDVLDEAERRRRGKTLNSLWGNEAAVMLGDLLLSRAFLLCSTLETANSARLIAAAASVVGEGELLQLYYRGYHDLSQQRYFELIGKKTGSLMAVCCELGGQIAEADQVVCGALGEYGNSLGMAFQIMDDVMDLVGDEREEGKTLGTDLAKEKMTLPLIRYLGTCSETDKLWVRGVLVSQRGSEVDELRERVLASGSVEWARNRAVEFVELAKDAVNKIGTVELREGLVELADMIVAGEKKI